jgi:ATP-binding protein involved in chromosome partitioning
MDVFGTGGGAEVAANLSRAVGAPVKLLGQVPLEKSVREHGDGGTPIVLADPDSPAGRAFREIADNLAVRPRGLAGMNLGIDTTRHL